ncbi:MAG: DUF4234 domain-containing protein [Chloroflexota bacterium]
MIRQGTPFSPIVLILLSIVTCGLFIIYWYFKILNELIQAEAPATGNDPVIDFLLAVVTCGLYGIYVDYCISRALVELQRRIGIPVNETAAIVIVLDVFGFGVIGSALHQKELNRIWESLQGGGTQ